MSERLSQDELNNLLSDEELAAIRGDDSDSAALAAIAGDGDDSGPDDDDGDDADDDSGADGEGEGEGEEGGAADAASDDKGPDAGTVTPDSDSSGNVPAGDAVAPVESNSDGRLIEEVEDATPTYVFKLPDDFDARVTSVEEGLAAITTKFRTGEIDVEQFAAEQAKLNAERVQLEGLRTKAELAEDMQRQATQHQWQANLNRFMAAAKATHGVDYRADEARASSLDMFVKALATKSENDGKPMAWFLNEAHKMVRALHGDIKVEQAPAPVDKKAAVQKARDERKPRLDVAPKTLAHVPGTEGPGDIGSEFANLDSLDGEDLENALLRMTPAQRERYAKGL